MNATQLISNLNSSIRSMKSDVDVNVNAVDDSTDSIQKTTDKILASVKQFRKDLIEGEEPQIARENILRINKILNAKYSNYKAIRRTVIGVVRDFDINLVRNTTIQDLSEELWMNTSDYWLSYALIAITAWVNDNAGIANNALMESGKRDAIKTSLFFCLMNLRFNRIEAAKQWFFEYIRTLDPNMLQQETAVVLQAFLNGIFGKSAEMEEQLTLQIDQWINIISNDVEQANALIDSYENYLKTMPTASSENYSNLRAYCSEYPEISKMFGNCSKFYTILDKVKEFGQLSDVPQTEENYKERVDEILIGLMSSYDEKESELKKQKQYYEFVIAQKGSIEAAKQQMEALEELESKNSSVGAKMVEWAVYDEKIDDNVKKFALRNTSEWFVRAVDKYELDVKKEMPAAYNLQIDTFKTTTNGNDLDTQEKYLNEFYSANKFKYKYINLVNIISFILLFIAIGICFVTPYAAIAVGVIAVFIVIRIATASKGFNKRKNKALDNLKKCMDELGQFNEYCKKAYEAKEDIVNEIKFI